MIYDNEYLQTLYTTHSLEKFLSLVNTEDIADPRTRAVVSALKRSIRVLNIEFNPILITAPTKKEEEINSPQQ